MRIMTRSSMLYWQNKFRCRLGKYKEFYAKCWNRRTLRLSVPPFLSTILFIFHPIFFCLFVCLNECTYSLYYTRQWIFTPNTHTRTHTKKEPLFTAVHFGFAHIILYNLTNKVLVLVVTQLCWFLIFFRGVSNTF